MALSNDDLNKLVKLGLLQTFKNLADLKYQDLAIEITGIEADTVEGALSELKGKITALGSVYNVKGSVNNYSDLPDGTTGHERKIGDVYNVVNAYTPAGGTDTYTAGTNWVWNGTAWDALGGTIDLSGYKTKQNAVADSDATTSGNAVIFVDSVTQDANGEITIHKKTVTTVSASTNGEGGNSGLMTAAQAEKLGDLPTNANLQTALNGKTDKVASATNGNFAGLDSNGNLTDSGKKASDFKTVLDAVSSPSTGDSTSTYEFIATVSLNTNGVISATKQAVRSASASQSGLMSSNDYSKLAALPTNSELNISLGAKADKVSNPTSGNFAALDENGNLTDSGHKHSDYLAAGSYKTTQTAVSDPTTGNSTTTYEFIATIAQNTNGEITATKQAVRNASGSLSGLMSASHYTKLENISYATDAEIYELFGLTYPSGD